MGPLIFTQARFRGEEKYLRGFTLVEMLVVLLVMGLLLGLVSVTARPDDRGRLRVESDRLAQLLTLAAEESRLTGKPIRWTSDGSSYRFWRLRSDDIWSEIRDDGPLRARSLPQDMAIAGLRLEAMPAQGAMRLEFTPYGPPASFIVEMSLGALRSMVASSPAGDVCVLPGPGEANASLALR